MDKKTKAIRRATLLVLAAALALGVCAYLVRRGENPHTMKQIIAATQLAAAAPAASQASPQTQPADYLDVVRAAYPEANLPHPLGVPTELSQAAHLVLHHPAYLSPPPRQELWITDASASPIERELARSADPANDIDIHVVQERVVFVHWMPTESGPWKPYAVCLTRSGGDALASIDAPRRALPDHGGYFWRHAISWNEKVAVPTSHGVSIFRFGPAIEESYHDLSSKKEQNSDARVKASEPSQSAPVLEFAEPRLLLDGQGLIAWMPWEAGRQGGAAARYVEPTDAPLSGPLRGAWTELSPDHGWPQRLLHLVPLLDGTVMLMSVDADGSVGVGYNVLQTQAVNENAVMGLIEGLSDPDGAVRAAAYDKLSQYGPGIWPILEKVVDDQPPEGKIKLRQLLRQRVAPTLNGMSLLGNKALKLAQRLGDGGTVFYAEAGVSIPHPDDPDAGPDYRIPAWISIRPGRPIELLTTVFTADLTPAVSQLFVNDNDWIVTSDTRGPRRFVGNSFVNLLRKSERGFGEFIGVDRRGRWVFRKPANPASPTTEPSIIVAEGGSPGSSRKGPGLPPSAITGKGSQARLRANLPAAPATDEVLLIDPTLPDPIPRLPVWVFNTANRVGWTDEGWPVAIKASAYALHETDWELVPPDKKIHTEIPPLAASQHTTTLSPPANAADSSTLTLPPSIGTSSPSTAPTTRPSSTSPAEIAAPLLIDSGGVRYFGGLTDLQVLRPDGQRLTWPLPDLANGQGPAVWLIKSPDGHLFLFNQPGRVVRLQINPPGSSRGPFTVEKIFTHHVPTVDHPTRIWLDPAGRIVMAWESQLALFFPTGYIPPAIADKMLLDDDADDE